MVLEAYAQSSTSVLALPICNKVTDIHVLYVYRPNLQVVFEVDIFNFWSYIPIYEGNFKKSNLGISPNRVNYHRQ